MKKYFLIASLFLAIFAIMSCNSKELEQLRKERDSLMNLSNENKSQLDQYMAAFNEIQQNLNMIKQKEQIISLNTTDTSEITPAMKDQINNDILTIYQLMQDNKNALETLKKQIKSSGVKNKQLEETIALYEQQMLQKDEEITQLKQKLEQMNFDMQSLNTKIDQMQQRMDTMQDIQNQQNQVINKQDEELHTAYYAYGTKDELKNKKILTRDGILAKLSLDPNFDKTYFQKIDYRNVEEIALNCASVEILTQHPSTSYQIVKNSKGNVEKIKITNKDNFWSMSKFLVIVIK